MQVMAGLRDRHMLIATSPHVDDETALWEMATPGEQAMRLTSHPANDQWPDLQGHPLR